MFENLSDRLNATLKKITGKGHLTEDNIKDTLRDVRTALLEADVALPVVKTFVEQIKNQALGQQVAQGLNPGQAFIQLVNDELVKIMGEQCEELNLATQPPAVILMAGLQGSGKTTSVAKLARWLQENQKKSVLVTSADIYRPAAIQQLEILAQEIGATFHPSDGNQKPVNIAKGAIDYAKKHAIDVVIVDTAGRLHIDDAMMQEIQQLHQAINPIETLFVVDSMTGQDAVNTAKVFNDTLALTGVILTKTDGDARGGAALSIRSVTGKPIKFLGIGEKTDALEAFHPDRVASRILGMGDMLSLIEEVERKVDKKKAEKLAKKLAKGKGFDLEDYLSQMEQMLDMGGMASLMDKLPGMGQIPEAAKNKVNDNVIKRNMAIVRSMTLQEKRFPKLLDKGSRKRRVANGSGTDIPAVNRMLKEFLKMQKMMKKMGKKGGMGRLMQQMQSKLPPGSMPF